MSTEIDERIVSMQFDNADFEKNVKQTQETLADLKKSLKFTGATDGLSEVNKAAKSMDFSVLSSALTSVKHSFSALEVIATTALVNITNSAVNAGKKITKALSLDPITTGFQEYETQMDAIQTILANTSSKGTVLDDVIESLDELNEYADKTIYNFTQMTANIGRFTAAGVDLQTATKSIQGIANLAAVSGSTATQASTAMYQLSQALSSGTVKLMDWNSVVNAGMGGEVFQNALKETSREMISTAESVWQMTEEEMKAFQELKGYTDADMAALEDYTYYVDDLIESSGSFRNSLSEGWITSDVLAKTLEKFTKSGANKYIAQMVDYTEDEIDAMRAMATQGITETEAIKGALRELAESIAGEDTDLQDKIYALLEMSETAENAATKVKTISQLWDTLKEAAQSGWAKTWQIVVGDFEEARSFLSEVSDALNEIIGESSDARNTLLQGWKDLGGRDVLIEAIRNSFAALVNVIKTVKVAFRNVFPAKTSNQLYDFTVKLKDMTEKLLLDENVLLKIQKTFEGFFSGVRIATDAVVGFVKSFAPLAGTGIKGIISGILALSSNIGNLISKVQIAITATDVFYRVCHAISEVLVALAGIVIDSFKIVGKALKTFFGKDTTDSIDTLDNSIEKFELTLENVENVLYSLAEVISSLDVSQYELQAISFAKTLREKVIRGLVSLKGKAENVIATVISCWNKAKIVIDEIAPYAEAAFSKLRYIYEKLIEWIKGIKSDASGISNLTSTFSKISSLRLSTDSLDSYSNAVNKIREGIAKVISAAEKFNGNLIDSVVEFVETAKFKMRSLWDYAVELKNKFSTKISELWNTIQSTGVYAYISGLASTADSILKIIVAVSSELSESIWSVLSSGVITSAFENVQSAVSYILPAIVQIIDSVISNLSTTFTAAGEAFYDVFGVSLLDSLTNIIDSVVEASRYLKFTQKDIENLTDTFRGMFAVLDIVSQMFSAAKSVIDDYFGGFDGFISVVLEITGGIGRLIFAIDQYLKETGMFEAIFSNLEIIVSTVVNVFRYFADGLDSNVVLSFVETIIRLIAGFRLSESMADNFGDALAGLASIGKIVVDVFVAIVDTLSSSGITIDSIVESILSVAGNIGRVFQKIAGVTDESNNISNAIEAIGNVLATIKEKAIEAFEAIKKLFDSFSGTSLFNVEALDFSWLTTIGDNVKSFFEGIKQNAEESGVTSIFDFLKTKYTLKFNGVGKALSSLTQFVRKTDEVAAAQDEMTKSLMFYPPAVAEGPIQGYVHRAASIDNIYEEYSELNSMMETTIDTHDKFLEFVGDAKKKLVGLSEYVQELKDNWSKLVEKIKSGLSYIKGTKFGESIGDELNKLKATIKDFLGDVTISDVVALVKTAFDTILTFKLIDFFDNLSDAVEGFAIKAKHVKFSSFGAELILFSVALLLFVDAAAKFNAIEFESWEKMVQVVGMLAGMMASLAITVKLLRGSSEAVEDSTDAATGIQGFLTKFTNKLKAGQSSALDMAILMLAIAEAVNILADACVKLADLDWGRCRVGFIAIEAFLASLAVIANTLVITLGKTNTSIKSFSKSANGMFADLKKTSSLWSMAAMILSFAAAIKVLADSVVLLGSLGNDEFEQGFKAVLILIGALTAALFLLTKNFGSNNIGVTTANIIGFSGAITAMAGAITALTIPICILGAIPLDNLIQGGIAVTALLAGLTAAMKVLQSFKMDKIGASMLGVSVGIMAMASAIMALTVPVLILGAIPLDMMIQGLIGVGVLIAGITAAISILNTSGINVANIAAISVAILALSVALTAISVPIIILGMIPWQNLATGLGALAAVLVVLVGAFVGAAYALSPVSGVLLAVSATMLAFGAAVALIGEGILKFAEAIAVLAISGTAAAAVFSEAMILIVEQLIISLPLIKELIIGIGAAVAEVAAMIILRVGQMLIDSIKDFVIQLCETAEILAKPLEKALVALGVLAIQLIKDLAPSAIDALLYIVDQAMVSLKNYLPSITGNFLEAISDTFIVFCNWIAEKTEGVAEIIGGTIGGAISGFISGLITGIADGMKDAMSTIAESMNQFAEDIQPFIDVLDAMPADAAIKAKILAEAMVALVGAGILDKISGFLSIIGDDPLVKLGKQLVGFSDYIIKFANKTKDIDADQFGKVANAMTAIAGFADSVPEYGLLDRIFGKDDMSKFGESLCQYGSYIKEFSKYISDIPDDITGKTALVSEVGVAMAELARTIPNDGGLLGFIVGNNDIGDFGASLARYGRGLRSFIKAINDDEFQLTSDTVGIVQNAAQASTYMSEFAKTIPNDEGLLGFIVGNNDIGDFGASLARYGRGLRSFVETICNDTFTFGNTETEAVENAAKVSKAMSEFAGTVPKSSIFKDLFTGFGDMESFGEDLVKYGGLLLTFSKAVSPLTGKGFYDVSNAAEVSMAMSEFANSIPKDDIFDFFSGKDGIDDFGKKLVGYAEYLIKFSNKASVLDKGSSDLAVSISKSLLEFVNEIPETGGLKSLVSGDNDLAEFGKQIASYGEYLAKFAAHVKTLSYEGVANAVEVSRALVGFAKEIPTTGGLIAMITGDNSLEDFGKNLVAFAPNLVKFASTVKNADYSGIEQSLIASKSLLDFAKDVNEAGTNTGIFKKWFSGDNSLSGFAEDLTSLGIGLNDYLETTKNMTTRGVEKSLNCARLVLDFAKELNAADAEASKVESTDKDGLFDKLLSGLFGSNSTGESTDVLATFGKTLASLGNHMKSFWGNIQDIEPTKFEAVVAQIKNLADTSTILSSLDAGTLNEFSDWLGNFAKNGISVFISEFEGNFEKAQTSGMEFVNRVGLGMTSNAYKVTDATETVISKIQNAISAYYDKTTYPEGFKQMGAMIITKLAAGMEESKASFNDTFRGLITGAVGTVTAIKGSLGQGKIGTTTTIYGAAGEIINCFKEAFEDDGNVQRIKKSFKDLMSRMLDVIKNDDGAMVSSAANQFIDKLVSFVNSQDKLGKVYEAGVRIAEEILSGFKSIDISAVISNSIDTATSNYIQELENAASSGTGIFENAINKVVDWLEEDHDFNPVITPVLDLSEVESGASEISAMFSRSQSMAISSDRNASQSEASTSGTAATVNPVYNFTQNNYSPKALDRTEIYRQTKNQFSSMQRTVITE